jgi:MoxR-like ATPase
MLSWRTIMGPVWEQPVDDAQIAELVSDYIARLVRDAALQPRLYGSDTTELRAATAEFLNAELRGRSGTAPWSRVRGALRRLGVEGDRYRAALNHFLAAVFSSAVSPHLAARIAAGLEWSEGSDPKVRS